MIKNQQKTEKTENEIEKYSTISLIPKHINSPKNLNKENEDLKKENNYLRKINETQKDLLHKLAKRLDIQDKNLEELKNQIMKLEDIVNKKTHIIKTLTSMLNNSAQK